MKITGAGKHRRRLTRMRGRELVLELSKQVYIAADRVRGEAQFLIAKGSIQGKGHQPSKPGEPPNLDTGVLTAGITARLTGSLKAVAESAAPYAAAQEYGHRYDDGRVLEERPYMRPAAKTVRKEYVINVSRAVARVNRKG